MVGQTIKLSAAKLRQMIMLAVITVSGLVLSWI